MTEKIFIYGTLMEKPRRELVVPKMKVLDIKPAFINGKMYSTYKQYPVVIFPNQGKRAKAPCLVYGALFTVDMTKHDMEALDRYEGCSRSTTGKNNDNDLYHRHHTKVKTFKFKDMLAFTKYELDVDKEEQTAWCWFGNMENPYIKKVAWDGHNRAGNVWRSFFGLFN